MKSIIIYTYIWDIYLWYIYNYGICDYGIYIIYMGYMGLFYNYIYQWDIDGIYMHVYIYRPQALGYFNLWEKKHDRISPLKNIHRKWPWKVRELNMFF